MNNYVRLHGVKYSTREITLPEYGTVTISTEKLSDNLFTEAGDYISNEAKTIDEDIFFFVPEDILLGSSDEELIHFVSSNL